MADSDFRVKAIIEANTSNFDKGMKQAQASATNLSNTFGSLSKIITKALSFAGLAVGTKAIVDFGKSCVQSANQAVKAFNILDNTIRATGADAWTSTKELDSMAKTLSDSTNYSVTEIENMQSVLLGFREITGETFQDASDAVLDMATVMGMDLTSAVQTVGKALDDPIRGLDSLRRQGFQFTDEQKAELAQMVKNGKKIEAQKIILDELTNSYGGASRAGQDSFAKQRHAVENFRDSLGTKLIPIVKVFTEDNAKMINSLRELVEKTDFTPVVNIVTNLKKIISETFERISDYLKKVGAEVQDFISRFNFKPITSLLDTLIGVLAGVINKFKEINSQKLEIFDQIKEGIIAFSNSDLFQNIVNFINKIIDAIFFLWSELQDVITEIRNLVVSKIIEIWNKIKELFQNSQNALASSGQDIASWGDLFYDVLNNAFKIFQDFFGMIKALIHGDWSVAWEYAKLTIMRMADNILDVFSTIANAFPDLINGILKGWNKVIEQINKARAFFGQDPLDLADMFESVDLSKKTGLEQKIEDTEKKIQELTGHTADIAIKDLQGVSIQFAGFTSSALGFIQDLTDGVATETGKQKTYFSGVTSGTESTYKKFSEWDLKLLQQRLENLDEWSDEYHKVQLDMIEAERQKAHDADTAGAETEKINEYYNKQIEKENERSEKAKRNKVKETMKVVLSTISNIAKKTVEVFKKVVSTIKSAFDSMVNLVKNITGIFSKLFEFNPSDALDNLLKIEDAILTFFVETLPQLPSFFESAFSSVLMLIQTLLNSIDWDNVKNILDSIINTFINYAPDILSGIVDMFVNMVSTISSVLVENAPAIISAIGQMFFTILEALPSLISNFLDTVGTYISEIGKYITDNAEKLSTDLTDIVKSIVDGISNFITSGGWKNLLSGLLTIQNAIQNAITENLDEIVNAIIEALPDLVDMLIKSIVSASKAMEKVIKPIIKLVLAVIEAIIDVLLSDEVLDAGIEAGMAIMDAIFDELIPQLAKLIPKLIVKIISFIVKNLPKIVKAMVEGLIKSFTQVNWIQVIVDIFTGFVDAIKDFFGIHSPSTLFESFGTYMVEGLIEGLKGISEAIMIILQPLFDLINGILDGILNGVIEMGSKALDFISNISEISFSALIDGLDSVLGFLTDITKLSFDSIVDLSKISFDALETTLKSISDVLEIISSTAVELVNVSFKGLASVIESIGKAVSSMTDSVTGLIKALTDLIKTVNDAIDKLNPFRSSSGGGGGGSSRKNIFEDPFGSGGILDPNPVSNPLMPWNWGKHATGTNNASRGLALVGEAGPELVWFNGGEQVLNSHNTQKALEGMGGKTINQSITFNNLQDTTAYAMMNQFKQYNRQMAINGVI